MTYRELSCKGLKYQKRVACQRGFAARVSGVWLVGICFLSLCLGGCGHFQKDRYLPYVVEFADPQRLRFHGKGGAAGMMMSSSMGPMGIAIGVAIDEGIAKDIQVAMNTSGCLLDQMVADAFERTSALHDRAVVKQDLHVQDVVSIKVQRVGFIATAGDADPAYAEVHLSLRFKGTDYSLSHPAKLEKEVNVVPLEHLKSDGALACQMLTAALQDAFEKWYDIQNLGSR
jgi:hypothetical protein